MLETDKQQAIAALDALAALAYTLLGPVSYKLWLDRQSVLTAQQIGLPPNMEAAIRGAIRSQMPGSQIVPFRPSGHSASDAARNPAASNTENDAPHDPNCA